MSVISVYRNFYWTRSRLIGQTGYVWETKEEQARCIADALISMALMSGVGMPTQVPRIKDQEQWDARYHIRNQSCLCGIHGYFSPNHLVLVMASGNGLGAVDRGGDLVHTRVRLGGLVDIHSLGARGEYGLIEEAWCDDTDISEAIAKQYDIPVNKSEYNKQPRTDPLIDNNTKVVKLSPMFADMSEAAAMKRPPNTTPGPTVGIKTFHMPTLSMSPPPQTTVAFLFGQPLTFQQYANLMVSNLRIQPNPFGSPTSRPLAPVTTNPPSVWNAKYSTPHAHNPALHLGALGTPKCMICGTYEHNHTESRCRAALLKTVTMTPIIKPGTITRLKRILGRAK